VALENGDFAVAVFLKARAHHVYVSFGRVDHQYIDDAIYLEVVIEDSVNV
jgi:hypothetical protein